MSILKHYGFEFSSSAGISPELSSAQNCFKMTLVVANIIFLIFGSVLCGVGAYATQSTAGALSGETLPQGIIALGVFIILMSFLGCVAAFRENRLFLGVYSALLLVLVLILLILGIGVLAKKDSAEQYMVDGWCAAPPEVQTDLQSTFSCCGLYYFNDSKGYGPNEYGPHNNFAVPAACPRSAAENKYKKYAYGVLPCPTGMVYENGPACLSILKSDFDSAYQAAGASAIAFSVLMGVFMGGVCLLMSAIKEKKHLEDIRKLHRKLREAKEDPTAADRISALQRAADDEAGYGGYGGQDVDLSGVDMGGYAAGGLDQSVQLDMAPEGTADVVEEEQQQPIEDEHYVVGGSAAPAAQPSSSRGSARGKGKKSRFAQPEPEPEPEEEYDEEAN